MVQSLNKNSLLVSKSHGKFGQIQAINEMTKKLKFGGLLLSKEYIPSAKTCAEDLTNIEFNFLCENSPNSLSHFWNHNSLFTDTTPSYFLSQTLHTSYKSSPSKCKFSEFPLLALKFTKFLMLFFKQKVSVSSKFGSLFSVKT